jgi:hypothetical protein
MLLVSRQAEGRALRKFVYKLSEAPQGLKIEQKPRQDTENSYIATVEGIDVHGADFEPGTAWLFSPFILQSVDFVELNPKGHIVSVDFEQGDDLKGSLVAEFRQRAIWNDWMIYDIKCEDPPEVEEQ